MFDLLVWKKRQLFFVSIVILVVFGVSFYQLQTSKMKTRDAQRKADTELVARALKAYFDDYRQYPLAGPNGEIISCGTDGAYPCAWGEDKIVDVDNLVYLERLPQEPFTDRGFTYVYEVDATRQHFKIYSILEYKRDQHYKTDLTTQCGSMAQCNWYAGF